MKQHFFASLNQSQGRAGWCIIFRHPLRSAKDGRPGLRVRRGLGTSNQDEAQKLIDQMNSLLNDHSLWNIAERSRAERLFDSKIVSAFYDYLTPEMRDPWAIRESIVHLPNPTEGYARVLMLGTTGAGKTTVVRQLIGTDPTTERFPSTSTAKCTVANMEVVLTADNSSYRTVITFFGKELIRKYIDECVTNAVIAYIETGNPEEVERKLLVHNEQRFRLSYLLGSSKLAVYDSDDDEGEEDPDKKTEQDPLEISSDERSQLIQHLSNYLSRIQTLAGSERDNLEKELSFSFGVASEEQRAAFEELLEENLVQSEEYQLLIDDILEDVESRFVQLQKGSLYRDKSGWPTHWLYETSERKDFIRTVNSFSSNNAPNFGRLLTPLVEGIRVAGPFRPNWNNECHPKLVLMDGEGLGHTPDSASSISTSVTRRYQDSDAIVLVDNAVQPMQAAPVALIRSLIASGHESKLIILLTHFDQVEGDNLPNRALKKEHVLNSFDSIAANIANDLGGQRVRNALIKCRTNRTFFLANIKRSLSLKSKEDKFTIEEFAKNLAVFSKLIEPPIPSSVIPVYYDADLIFRIQTAMQEFHEPWKARLGFPSLSTLRKEHWARIKALARRLGEMGIDEYDTLQPVANLISRLSEHISEFLINPISFEPANAPEEMCNAAIDQVKREFYKRLEYDAKKRLLTAKTNEWYKAYQYRGPGSSMSREVDVKTIYDTAAPIPSGSSNEYSRRFLSEMRQLVKEAIIAGGGKFST